MSLANLRTLGEFQNILEIGRGAHSIVYQGDKDGTRYAIKLLRPELLEKKRDAYVARLRREAGIIVRLNSPGAARVMAVGEHEGAPYLVMEFVEGGSLADMIARRTRLSEQETVAIAKSLARTLGALHKLGVVHRDIKPDNVLISPSGEAKLIDFGLAADSTADESSEGAAVGTFLYSAPEQTGMLNRRLDGRADLYSLGVLLFECVVGRPPFLSNDIAELMRMHAVTAAPDVRTLRPELSAEISAIIARLLAKDPDDRYLSADGLLIDLAADTVTHRSERSLGRHVQAPQAFKTPLVGREQELAALRKALGDAQSGRQSFSLLEGEPGSGKSRLVAEALSLVRSGSDALILSAKCRMENSLSLDALREMLSNLANDTSWFTDERRRGLMHEAVSKSPVALFRLAPRLVTKVLPKDESWEGIEIGAEQLIDGFAEFVASLARPTGGIVFVDDVQWIDEGSRAAMRRLAERAASAKIALITTARNDSASNARVEAFVTEMGDRLRTRLALTPLSDDEIGALIRAHLGGHNVDSSFLSHVKRLAHGSPFAAGEFVRAMLEEGGLIFRWGEWHADKQAIEHLSLHRDVSQLLLTRLTRLDAQTLGVLRIAALLGHSFRTDHFAELCAVSEEAVSRALFTAASAALIEAAKNGEYAFIHDRVQEALLASMNAGEQKTRHAQIAELLSRQDDNGFEHLFAVARHFGAAEEMADQTKAAAASLSAGMAALGELADEQAYGFLMRAKGDSDLARRADLWRSLGEACVRTKRYSEAFGCYDKALEFERAPLTRALIRQSLAKNCVQSERLERFGPEIEAAFEEVGEPYPRGKPLQIIGALLMCVLGLFLVRLNVRAGLARGARREHLRVLIELYYLANYRALIFQDLPSLIQTSFAPAYMAYRVGVCTQRMMGIGGVAAALAAMGSKASVGLLERALKVGESVGDRMGVARYTVYLGMTYDSLGDVSKALGAYDTAFKQRRWLDFTDLYTCSAVPAWIRMMQGRHSEAWSLLRSMDENAPPPQREGAPRHPGHPYCAAMARSQGLNAVAAEHDKLALAFVEANNLAYHWGFQASVAVFEEFMLGAKPNDVDGVALWDKKSRVPPTQAFIYQAPFFSFRALLKVEAALQERGRTEADARELKELRKLVKDALRGSKVPLILQYALLAQAELFALEGDMKRSLQTFERAERMARETDSPLAEFEVRRRRARLLLRQNHGGLEAKLDAELAAQIAAAFGWVAKLRQLERDFPSAVNSQHTRMAPAGGATSASSSSSGSSDSLRTRRQLRALLEVSLAAGTVIDSTLQARVALDQLVRLLAAERGYLFMLNDKGQLVAKAGRDSEGRDLSLATGYSTTVVERVHTTGKPLIVSGTEEGRLLGSESAVVHDLRSIAAAPVMLRDRLNGVVYLDNRAIRGIFAEGDLEILTALASQIAVAQETARVTQVELARQALEKDLAVTAAVQGLLLPETSEAKGAGFSLSGTYQPADQSGGDWWWYEILEDGSVDVFVADLTGHGAGSAMMTAALANGYMTLKSMGLHHDHVKLLSTLNASLHALAHGTYRATMTAWRLRPSSREFELTSAGGLPVLVLDQDGKLAPITVPGVALGDPSFEVKTHTGTLTPGSRVVIMTDGLTEAAAPNGRQFGTRGVAKILNEAKQLDLAAAGETIRARLEAHRAGGKPDDDVTFVLLDVT